MSTSLIKSFCEIGRADVAIVGGKNALLGELIGAMTAVGVRVPRVSRRQQRPIGPFSTPMACASR
jgi:hypothetical protein